MAFPIFEESKDKGIHIINVIALILAFISIPKIFMPTYFGLIPNAAVYIFLTYLLFLIVWNSNRVESEYGKFIGSFILFKEKMVILNRSIPLSDIDIIEIIANDYKDKRCNTFNVFSASKSNGLKNTITVKLVDGNKIEHRFQQFKRKNIAQEKDCLIEYYLKGKMSWLMLTSIIGLNSIEQFKLKKKTNANN